MNQPIITITTGGQGSPVVKSARELHGFLEVKTRFNDWFKNRVNKYGFVEGRDYEAVTDEPTGEGFTKNSVKPQGEGFSKNVEKGGRPELDYALTLNMAKELSMVERNAKGKQARQYFIDCEERLRQIADQLAAPALTTEQLLVQLLTNQQQQLEQLRADVEQIRHTGHRPGSPTPARPGKQLGLPGMPPAHTARQRAASLRQQITHRVNDYCQMIGATSHETWTYLYKRLYDVYGISTYRLLRASGESMLDALERYGHLDRLDSLIRAELDYRDE